MATRATPYFSWITAQADRTEHAVLDEAHVAGMEAGNGRYEPLCGETFLAACMDVGPSRSCQRCWVFIRARAELRSFEERLTAYRRPGWLARLLCRYQQPAGVGSETTTSPNAPTSAGLQPSAGAPERVPRILSEPAPVDAPRHRRGRHAA